MAPPCLSPASDARSSLHPPLPGLLERVMFRVIGPSCRPRGPLGTASPRQEGSCSGAGEEHLAREGVCV